jgi:hypothetical protein
MPLQRYGTSSESPPNHQELAMLIELPHYLYHGTSLKYLGQILRDGITPRSCNGNSNWDGLLSLPDRVYLTDLYAPYFAFCSQGSDVDGWLILEIELARLDESLLRPDEDYYTGDFLASSEVSREQSIERANDPATNYEWRQSLVGYGTVAVKGAIKASEIHSFLMIEPDNEEFEYLNQRAYWLRRHTLFRHDSELRAQMEEFMGLVLSISQKIPTRTVKRHARTVLPQEKGDSLRHAGES